MSHEILLERIGQVGCITLNRPKALNALSLGMVRAITTAMLHWRSDPDVLAVALRGMGREGPFSCFCAGGDIRFFHAAALAGDPSLEDFFTEEYALNHLIHSYGKPVVAFLDGIVMGGGMGLAQGASLRLVTERTRMAMPETAIGLFPDVGGGYFLSRCPGCVGEYLGMSGVSFGARDALAWGLADAEVPAVQMPVLWQAMAHVSASNSASWLRQWQELLPAWAASEVGHQALPELDACFDAADATAVVHRLGASSHAWARECAQLMRQRSPLMVHVTLEQVRRSRCMGVADALRMERDLVRHCFHTMHLGRRGASSETVEGIRALAIDKDHQPRWQPARLEDVTPEIVAPFFASPWPEHAHPLRWLVD